MPKSIPHFFDQDGLCETIDRGYLRSFHMAIHGPGDGSLRPNTLIDSYTMSFTYGPDLQMQLSGSNNGTFEEIPLATFKGKLHDLIQNVLREFMSTRKKLPPIPSTSFHSSSVPVVISA